MLDKGVGLGTERARQHPARPVTGDLGQRVINRFRLMQGDYVGIVLHGVSLLLEVLAGLDTRHDTPPSQTPSPRIPHSSNPTRARRFAQTISQGAKTDRVDAAMLARMGAVLDLEAKPARSESMHQIRELHIARIALNKDRTACRNRLEGARNKVVLAQLRARLRQVDGQIAQINAELQRLIAEDPGLARREAILRSIPGIGAVTAVAMIVEMPELGTMEGKEAASLAGLAPITRESGKWKGRSKIGGGRRGVRNARYMPALVAIRHNPQLGEIYRTLCTAGKPAKLAIAAVMRRLVILANALVRDDQTWTETAP